MANFTRGTSWNNDNNIITPGTSTKTITISTAGKYVDKDIVIKIGGMGNYNKVGLKASTNNAFALDSDVPSQAYFSVYNNNYTTPEQICVVYANSTEDEDIRLYSVPTRMTELLNDLDWLVDVQV